MIIHETDKCVKSQIVNFEFTGCNYILDIRYVSIMKLLLVYSSLVMNALSISVNYSGPWTNS